MGIYKDKFGSLKSSKRMIKFFDDQSFLVKKCVIYIAHNEKLNNSSIKYLLYGLAYSCESLSILGKRNKSRECYIIGRSIFETILNICYICSEGKEVDESAKLHAIQKSIRDLDREVKINDFKIEYKWTGEIDMSSNPSIATAFDKFTTKRGKEISSWTPETIHDRLKIVESKYGHDIVGALLIAYSLIYRNASELIHGTFFGALFSLGLTYPNEPPKSQKEQNTHNRQHISTITMILGASIDTLIHVLQKELSLGTLPQQSKSAIQKLNKEGFVHE